jgi:hypothetical protein
MTEQKSVSIRVDKECSEADIDNVINKNIREGWRVAHIASTGGCSNQNFRLYPTLVIIFERTKTS